MGGSMRNPRFWVGMLISMAALIFAYTRIDVDEALQAFREAQYVWLIPAAAFTLASLVFRAFRWRALFHPTQLPFGHVFGILTTGYLVTTLLPLRLGDFVRVHIIGEMHAIRKGRALSTVVVERVLDVLTVIVILLALLPFVPVPGYVRTVLWIGVPGMMVIIGFIAMLWFKRQRALDLLESRLHWLPDGWEEMIHEHAEAVLQGLSVLDSGKSLAKSAGWSALTWIAGGCMMWVMLLAFGLPHSPSIAFFLLAMSALSMVIPSSPGFIGVYHAIIIETLVTIFGAPRGLSASFAILTHLLLFVPTVVCGVGYMMREPEIWNQLLRWRRRASRGEGTQVTARP
jgi:glycosyltransferase 2 family protein